MVVGSVAGESRKDPHVPSLSRNVTGAYAWVVDPTIDGVSGLIPGVPTHLRGRATEAGRTASVAVQPLFLAAHSSFHAH